MTMPVQEALSLLWPRPISASSSGWIRLPSRPTVAQPVERADRAGKWILERLTSLGLQPRLVAGEQADIRLLLEPARAFPPQGYQLDVSREGIEIRAGDPPGLFYGANTLCQWILLHRWPETRSEEARRLPGLRVVDAPAFSARGVMLDISRNRVPTLESLLRLVDLLASLKINQLQLYMEHTFAYRGHEVVWSGWSPWTADEIRRLDHHCQLRHIELVPNQNSFGHFHRWLVHEPYRHLAECPEGIEHPFSEVKEPFSLCPLDPGSLALLEDLYGQLLPCFSSSLFNVGLDETFDLGVGRSAAACAAKGKGRVYLEFLQQIHCRVRGYGKRMMFWGDIVLKRPELIAELPGDVIAVEWGYEADHPFAADGRRFAAAGLEFHVCPGTSSWHSFAGRLENSLHNLANAARNGKREGSSGYLIADWGDNGHLQPQAVSYPAFLVGAGFSWNPRSAEDLTSFPLARLLDVFVFSDRSENLGQSVIDLGNAYLHTGAPPEGAPAINGSALFFLLMFAHKPVAQRRCDSLTPGGLRRTLHQVEAAMCRLGEAGGLVEEGELARRELQWVGETLELACRLGEPWLEAGLATPASGLPESPRKWALRRLEKLEQELRFLWKARCRPGGLEASVARLTRLRQLLGK